jgi:Predicted transcriptional regulator
MNARFFEKIKLFKRIDYLISRKSTGSPESLADRLEVSRASIFRYINELKNLGAPINYCKDRGTYYYSEPYQLEF